MLFFYSNFYFFIFLFFSIFSHSFPGRISRVVVSAGMVVNPMLPPSSTLLRWSCYGGEVAMVLGFLFLGQ